MNATRDALSPLVYPEGSNHNLPGLSIDLSSDQSTIGLKTSSNGLRVRVPYTPTMFHMEPQQTKIQRFNILNPSRFEALCSVLRQALRRPSLPGIAVTSSSSSRASMPRRVRGGAGARTAHALNVKARSIFCFFFSFFFFKSHHDYPHVTMRYRIERLHVVVTKTA